MPFIPHTDDDIQSMLSTIGVKSIDDLFSEIPQNLRLGQLNNIPAGLNEMAVSRLLRTLAAKDDQQMCFIGAGAYEHYIPAAVWDIASRGEFMTAYTPYQAEASQGTLQLLYEFQTMIASLTGMEAANASLYEGASALAEAILMAIRANKKVKAKRVLVPATVHPAYRKTLQAILSTQDIEIVEVPFCHKAGCTIVSSLDAYAKQEIAAVVIPQPNFFGVLEPVDALTDWAHQHNALAIAVVNPIALALLKEPGAWGEQGVDIVCGEGQPLGVPLASGGPYFGFLSCKKAIVRQMPGRIVGRTVDADGKPGFALTLQAREQHIRRSKATSNICTNQGLAVTAATIYMSILGPAGLKNVAQACHQKTLSLVNKLTAIEGIERVFTQPLFHEVVVKLSKPVSEVLAVFAQHNIQAGFDVSQAYPELDNCLLICVTETKTETDIDHYVACMTAALCGSSVSTLSSEVQA